jgi:hypothetical protein
MKVAVNIRMPDDMKAALDKIAGGEFRSLNSLILQLLAEALKARGVDWRAEEEEASPPPRPDKVGLFD